MSTPFILSGDAAPFRDAVILGQGLPLEKDGHACHYRWKESLPIGRYLDKNKKPFEVTPQRIETLIANFNKAKAKGFTPPILDRHEKTGSASLGFIVQARKGENGSLELLHQFVGDDAVKLAARNKTSICTVANATDETGETYSELIDHNALVPDPQLNNLSDFQPAIAASRGQAQQAVVLTLAASEPKESAMDLTKLREAIGAAKEVTDEKVIEQAIAKLIEATPALELSRTQAATITTLTSERDNAKAALATAQQKPDANLLKGWSDLTAGKIDLCLSQGKCTKAQADVLKAALKEGDAPNVLMLSRGTGGESPLDVALKVLELNKPFTGVATGHQALPDPNVVNDAVKAGRETAQEYQNRQLAARGMQAA